MTALSCRCTVTKLNVRLFIVVWVNDLLNIPHLTTIIHEIYIKDNSYKNRKYGSLINQEKYHKI